MPPVPTPSVPSGHLPLTGGVGPGPPLFLRGSHQGARLYPSGAGKRQDTAPCAARCAAVGGFAALRMRRTPCGCCRSVLVEQADAPTRAIAPGFQISRGGSVVAPPPWLVLRAGEWLQHSRPLGLQRPFGPLTSAPIPALEFSGYRQPPGVHPIGGRKGDPMEAQRSGFHWERTSDGMSEPCPSRARRMI